MLFSTLNCEHLVDDMSLKKGKAIIKTFADGEVYVQVEDDVKDKRIWVVAETQPPTDNYFQLFFLLDALKRAGAQINLFLTYFGYARQDRAKPGEALSSEVMCKILQLFDIKKIAIMHLHNPTICSFLPIKNVIPFDFFYTIAQNVDCIVAPDEGAHAFAQKIAQDSNKDLAVIAKKRSNGSLSILDFVGDVKDKSVLIVDDMISTGGTIIQAAARLKEQGAKEVFVAATHGIFAGDAIKNIEKSSIKHVWVTNSLPQKKHEIVTVVNIAPIIESYITST